MGIGYQSEYILSGNINSNAKSLNLETSYKNRDWRDYVNASQRATSADVLTRMNLNDWYSKYTNEPNANVWGTDTFQQIYNTRYENLIDNCSYYWLATACNERRILGFGPTI